MKTKKIIMLMLAVLILPCVLTFSGCFGQEKILDVRISGMKTTFEYGENFSLGNAKVEKLVKEEWKTVPSADFEIDTQKTTFNQLEAGVHTIYINVKNSDKQISYEVTVEKGTTPFVALNDIEAEWGQTLADVELPNEYVWEDETLSVGDLTSDGRAFNAIYTKNENYNSVNGQILVKVVKATPAFEPLEITTKWASNMAKISSVTLPAGYEWKNPETYLGNATLEGREFDAIFTKSSNHNPVEGKVKVIIQKADPVFYTHNAINAVYGQYLYELEFSYSGYEWVDPFQLVGDATEGNECRFFQVYFTLSENYEKADGYIGVRVAKAPAVSFVAPAPITAYYGQTLADLTLPEGYAWVDSTLSVGEVTSEGHLFEATYAPNSNYNTSTGNVRVIVEKATPEFETIEPITITYQEGQILESVILPDGYAWVNPQLEVGDVTTDGREFDAIFTKSENHNPVQGKVKIIVTEISQE